MSKGVKLREFFAGVLPFLALDAVRVVLLVFFPALTLTLPRLLAN